MIPLFKVLMAPEAAEAVARVLASGYIGEGPEVAAFEAELSIALHTPVLAVNSGTSALTLALRCAGAGPGTVVICPTMTCTATPSAAIALGARVAWADVDPRTGLLDLDAVARLLRIYGGQVRAILAVDWGGAQPDYVALREIAQRVDAAVVEDAAHRLAPLPATDARGHYVCWSFQAIKFLTTGDGGALATPPGQFDRARVLRWFGLDRRSRADFRCEQRIQEAGYKFHLTDVAAAIGRANLEHALGAVEAQQLNAALLRGLLADEPACAPVLASQGSSCWLFSVRLADAAARAAFQAHLQAAGIASSRVHARCDAHPGLDARAVASGTLPGTDEFDARALAVPCGWWLSPADTLAVGETCAAWAQAQEVA